MADQFDRASELESLALESAMNEHQSRAAGAKRLRPSGFCLNPACEESFEGPGAGSRLFCNPACGAEHTRRSK